MKRREATHEVEDRIYVRAAQGQTAEVCQARLYIDDDKIYEFRHPRVRITK